MTPDDLTGIVNATVDMDCDVCGLNIHVGDPIALGRNQWVHPICAVEYEQELAAERRHDADRERGV